MVLCYSREEKKAEHYDSLQSQNDKQADVVLKRLLCYVYPESSDVNIALQRAECKQQRNSHDCGVHVLMNAERFLTAFMEELDRKTTDAAGADGGRKKGGKEDVGTMCSSAGQMRRKVLAAIDRLKCSD
jgi:Ulp1 family protease